MAKKPGGRIMHVEGLTREIEHESKAFSE